MVVLTPAGELDMLTAPVLLERVEMHLERRDHAVIDMRDVTFLGSSGLHSLLAAKSAAQAAGTQLHLTGTDTPSTARVLRLSGLAPVLPIEQSSTGELLVSLVEADAGG
ncbi:anti-sigma factor antagonist [Pseudonocardia acidicola]|uniref:Anti-sigma factor antagonist n=1 Tax=Pseudonocardia acidicola TaxID=2724939 RepID=A0ABX1S3N7_9PSEU|nr:STAS domain-containing protein [Pseudonocardia acidicola]